MRDFANLDDGSVRDRTANRTWSRPIGAVDK